MNLYSILVSFLILFYSLLLKTKLQKEIKEDIYWKIFFLTLIISIIGAKIFHILENLNLYLANPSLLEITKGYSVLGAIFFGYLFLTIFEHVNKTDLTNLKIYTFLYLPLVQAIGRIGNMFNQELLSYASDEIYLNLANFFILYYFFKKLNKKYIPFLYFFNYGIIRFSLELIKGNPGFLFAISILFIFYGFLNIFKLRLKV